MRYHYEKPTVHKQIYGTTYACNHPIYNTCMLFKINDKGLAVVQQRYYQKKNKRYILEPHRPMPSGRTKSK